MPTKWALWDRKRHRVEGILVEIEGTESSSVAHVIGRVIPSGLVQGAGRREIRQRDEKI